MRAAAGACAASSVALAAAVVFAGCSSLLGLGDFTDDKADASAGSGGTSGTGATAGVGGMDASAGGTDAGAGGTDAGSGVTCDPQGPPFEVIGDSDTNHLTSRDSLFVASAQHVAYVVMGMEDGSQVLVRPVTDQTGSGRLGNLVTYTPSSFLNVTGAQVVGSTLHVTGSRPNPTGLGDEGIDLAYPINGNSIAAAPTPTPYALPAGCPIHRTEFYRYDSSGNVHSALTCQTNTGDASTDTSKLYVDGHLLASGAVTDHSVEVTNFVLSNGEYVVVTGEGPGEGVVYHAKVGSTTFGSPLKLQLSSKTDELSWAMLAWPSTGATSVMGALITVKNNNPTTPASIWQGVFPNLEDLGKPSPSGMQKLFDLTAVGSFVQYHDPEVVQAGMVMAGATFLADQVRFAMFKPAGTPAFVNRNVSDAGQTEEIVDAAAGFLGSSPLVVWNVHDTIASTSRVLGQPYLCNGL